VLLLAETQTIAENAFQNKRI